MNAPEPDAALREDIRTLGNLLGQSLAQHGGPELLEAVERIRAAVRDDPAEATRIIDQIDLHEATLIARAFSIYFDLANVAEQVQRARDVRARRRTEGSLLTRTAGRALDLGATPEQARLLAEEISSRLDISAGAWGVL